MKRLTLALALALAALAVARPARAQSLDDQLKLLDGDAPILMTVKPKALWAGFGWLRSIGGQVGMFVQASVGSIQNDLKKTFGFDPTTSEGFAASGLDPEAAVVASVMALDAAYERSYRALSKAADAKAMARVARTFWRTRLVARVKDEAKLRAMLTAMVRAGGPSAASLDGAGAGDLGQLLGVDAKQGEKLKKQLAARRILAVARPDRDGAGRMITFARLEGTLLVADAIAGFGDLPLDWKRDGNEILKQLGRKPRGLAAVLQRGAGTQVAAADAAVWVEPMRALDLGKATGRENVLAAVRGVQDGKKLLEQGEKEVLRCEDFRGVAREGPFEDFAWTFRADGKAFEMAGVWGLRAGSTLPAALQASDDGLLELATARDALAVGVLYAQGVKPLRALPRPGIFAKDLAQVEEAERLCGFAGHLMTLLFAWPQYASLVMESQPKEVLAALDQARNVAFAFKTFGMSQADNVGVVLASVAATAAPLVDAAMVAKLGAKGTRKVGSKSVEVWRPRAPNDPTGVRAPLPGGRLAAGFAFGGNAALDWFYGRPSPKATPGQTPLLAAGRLDVPKTIQVFAKADPYAGAMATDVAKRLGMLSGVARLSGQTLVGTLRLEIK